MPIFLLSCLSLSPRARFFREDRARAREKDSIDYFAVREEKREESIYAQVKARERVTQFSPTLQLHYDTRAPCAGRVMARVCACVCWS